MILRRCDEDIHCWHTVKEKSRIKSICCWCDDELISKPAVFEHGPHLEKYECEASDLVGPFNVLLRWRR